MSANALPFADFSIPVLNSSGNLSILVEVSQFSDLGPQVSHDLLVFLEHGFIPVTLAFNDGVADSQAFEITFVQCSVAVNVIHIPDDEFDAVIPRISHCSLIWFVLIRTTRNGHDCGRVNSPH